LRSYPAARSPRAKPASAAGDPDRDGFAEELTASRRLYGEAPTRERVQAFLARSMQPARVS
jgi:hypothetical protein